MLRKALANRNPVAAAGIDDDDAPVTTQEYIRRALEDGEDDDDFNRNPWLSALEFLGHQGRGSIGCLFGSISLYLFGLTCSDSW